MTLTKKLTKAQREALERATPDEGFKSLPPAGYVPGPTSVKRALARRGFIDAQGCITDAGRAALQQQQPKKPKLSDEEREERFRDAARDAHGTDGEIEIDDGADVSESDSGAYVQAWVWVSNEDAGLDE